MPALSDTKNAAANISAFDLSWLDTKTLQSVYSSTCKFTNFQTASYTAPKWWESDSIWDWVSKAGQKKQMESNESWDDVLSNSEQTTLYSQSRQKVRQDWGYLNLTGKKNGVRCKEVKNINIWAVPADTCQPWRISRTANNRTVNGYFVTTPKDGLLSEVQWYLRLIDGGLTALSAQ